MSAEPRTDIGTLLVATPGIVGGRLRLQGTRIPVTNVAAYYQQGITAEEMAAENPNLSPALFHAAVAYYLANKAQIDAEIEADLRHDAELAAKFPDGIYRPELDID